MRKKHKVWVYTGITALMLLYIFFNNVNLNPFYQDSAAFYAMAVTVYVVAWAIMKLGGLRLVRDGDNPHVKVVNVEFGGGKKKFPKTAIVILAAVWIFFGGVSLFSSVLFNVNAYKNQLTEPIVGEFTEDIQPVDLENVPVVDQELAYKLAVKKLGENSSVGSQAHIDINTVTIQQVDGKLMWVAPLHHSGLFKWFANLDGSPGYITVSASDPQDVEYREDYKIKIQPGSAYLMDDLERHTRFNAALFTGITDYSFEIDDDGNPYWIVTTYKNRRGFSLPEASGIVLVNAQTGDCQKYALKDVPEWVDRVQPEDFVINQINNRGEYVHGFLNFSNKDKFTTSEGHIIVYNDGRCYLFTGLTSVGADDSTIGFIMVDMVTKETYQYKLGGGATEEAAQKSANGKVQQYGYQASFPLIINLNNAPTYFMPLKDNEGLIKQYAFVSVKNYQLVGVGETIGDAERDYMRALQSSGDNTIRPGDTTTEEQTLEGTVLRIAQEQSDGDTRYKFLLDTGDGVIFVSAAKVSDELALTQAGDRVKVTFSGPADAVTTVTAFDNLAIGTTES